MIETRLAACCGCLLGEKMRAAQQDCGRIANKALTGAMGQKITLERAIYQGDRMVTAHCFAPHCYNSGDARLIEMIDSYGPATCLDDLPFRCESCGRRDCVDVRARPFKTDGRGSRGAALESDGLPYGNQHMTWIER